jgi:hypothetical protein
VVRNLDWVLAFFTTCAQTFAALVSIFGMFVVYRLQVEEDRIGHLRERMIEFHESHKKLPFESVIAAMQNLAQLYEKKDQPEISKTIDILLHHYEGAVKKQRWLESAAKRPILLMLALIFVSLLAVVTAPLYIGSDRIKWAFLWGTLLISAVPLWEIGLVVLKSIAGD